MDIKKFAKITFFTFLFLIPFGIKDENSKANAKTVRELIQRSQKEKENYEREINERYKKIINEYSNQTKAKINSIIESLGIKSSRKSLQYEEEIKNYQRSEKEKFESMLKEKQNEFQRKINNMNFKLQNKRLHLRSRSESNYFKEDFRDEMNLFLNSKENQNKTELENFAKDYIKPFERSDIFSRLIPNLKKKSERLSLKILLKHSKNKTKQG